ncbi:MAG: energy transducer TonB [Saprospiraceae bacterium]|nr:energy transducer TonB [Saprospiraceae bacterium]
MKHIYFNIAFLIGIFAIPSFSQKETVYFALIDNEYKEVQLDVKPEFIGGLTLLSKKMAGNIRYPAKARENNIKGNVLLNIYLNENGKVEDITLAKGIGGGCNEESIRAVWIVTNGGYNPAIYKGKPIKVKFEVPISFKLE